MSMAWSLYQIPRPHQIKELGRVLAWNFRFFGLKRRHFQKLCKFLAINALGTLDTLLKNVLTAKTGLFFGRFGRKTGGPRLIKTILFWVSSVFWAFAALQAIDGQ
jgi:hypothetical protein